jgi:hypothetical protein
MARAVFATLILLAIATQADALELKPLSKSDFEQATPQQLSNLLVRCAGDLAELALLGVEAGEQASAEEYIAEGTNFLLAAWRIAYKDNQPAEESNLIQAMKPYQAAYSDYVAATLDKGGSDAQMLPDDVMLCREHAPKA